MIIILFPIFIILGIGGCVLYYLYYKNEINRRVREGITTGKAMLPPGAVIMITVILELMAFCVLLLCLMITTA